MPGETESSELRFRKVPEKNEFVRSLLPKQRQVRLHNCSVFEQLFRGKYGRHKSLGGLFWANLLVLISFQEVRKYLGHELRLPDLLIKPIQRVMKYELILTNLMKYTKEAGIQEDLESLGKALNYMRVVPRITNDMMVLSRLVNFEGSIMNHGKLIRQGFLMVSRNKLASSPLNISLHFSFNSPRSTLKRRYVFLFEQIVIFCKVSSNGHFNYYIYKFHLNTSKISVSILNCPEEGQFHMHVKDSLVADGDAEVSLPIVCKAENFREREEWINDIQKIVNFQNHFINALVAPTVYQNSPLY